MSDFNIDQKRESLGFVKDPEPEVEETVEEEIVVVSNYDQLVSALQHISRIAPSTGGPHPAVAAVGDVARAALSAVDERAA